jgi:DNA invertase Pin-like site-specific DNA recombinase
VAAGTAVIGYVSAPVTLNGDGGDAPDRAIARACDRAGWHLVDTVSDAGGEAATDRPRLDEALRRIADGEAQGLVVSDTRLLSRSTDLGALTKRLASGGASLIALDLGVDTATADGARVLGALVAMSGWGRLRDGNGNGKGKGAVPAREPKEVAARR